MASSRSSELQQKLQVMQIATTAAADSPDRVWILEGSSLSKSVMIYLAHKFIEKAKQLVELEEWSVHGGVIKIEPNPWHYDPASLRRTGPPKIVFEGYLHVCKDDDDMDRYMFTHFVGHAELATDAEHYCSGNPEEVEWISRGMKLVNKKRFYRCCRAAKCISEDSKLRER